MRRGRFRRFAAFVLTATFVLACVAAYTNHTDDGCPVEMHCFACHWAFASTGTVAEPLAFEVGLHVEGTVLPSLLPLSPDTPPPASSSRGPPAL